jgi:hypothetical protein
MFEPYTDLPPYSSTPGPHNIYVLVRISATSNTTSNPIHLSTSVLSENNQTPYLISAHRNRDNAEQALTNWVNITPGTTLAEIMRIPGMRYAAWDYGWPVRLNGVLDGRVWIEETLLKD